MCSLDISNTFRPLVEDMDFVVRCKLSALYKRTGDSTDTEASSTRLTIHPAMIRIVHIPFRNVEVRTLVIFGELIDHVDGNCRASCSPS